MAKKDDSVRRLAAIVAGKRRALENAIYKLANADLQVGLSAADIAAMHLSQTARRLRDDEIQRLKTDHPR